MKKKIIILIFGLLVSNFGFGQPGNFNYPGTNECFVRVLLEETSVFGGFCYCDTTYLEIDCPNLPLEDWPDQVNWYWYVSDGSSIYPQNINNNEWSMDTFICRPFDTLAEGIYVLLIFQDDTFYTSVNYPYDYCQIGTTWIEQTQKTICQGDFIDFKGFTDPAALYYDWWFEGAAINQSSQQNPLGVFYPDTGVFDILLITSSPPTGVWEQLPFDHAVDTLFLEDYITVLPRQSIIADTVQNIVVSIGDQITLDACVEGDTYIWLPTDGLSCLDCDQTTAIVDVASQYTCLVTTEGYCPNVCTYNLQYTDEDRIFVPNTFSPNYDGINDNFVVFGDKIDILEMLVFDRWGNQIFEYDPSKPSWWDGSFRGVESPMGPYGWYVRFYNQRTDKEKLISGSVTLMR
jgi:gliding motility-associated-like protein